MKKLLILCLTLGLMLPLEATVEAAAVDVRSVNGELQNTLVLKRKKARAYRKKKGFMWGLFKKKNGCGCPKF
ncbi:hypothetical protein GCM10027347_39680 [Larkinella harenae]